MEDFPLLDVLIDNCKEWLKSHSDNTEPCAAVIARKGRYKLVPLENKSDDPENYFSLGDDFVALSLSNDILFVVHAHPDNCTPSEYDMSCCNLLKIPYIVFNKSNMEYTIVYPNNYKNLIGREYVFGKQDCFEACRDWYSLHGILLPTRDPEWKDDWWLEGLDYIKDLENWGFKETTSLEYGNLLVFGDNINNHIGVYIDNDIFYHHAVNRLSCRENIYPLWGSMLKKVYKYEKSNITRAPWR